MLADMKKMCLLLLIILICSCIILIGNNCVINMTGNLTWQIQWLLHQKKPMQFHINLKETFSGCRLPTAPLLLTSLYRFKIIIIVAIIKNNSNKILQVSFLSKLAFPEHLEALWSYLLPKKNK